MTRLSRTSATPDDSPVFSAGNVSILPELPDTVNKVVEAGPLQMDARVRQHYQRSAALYKCWSPAGHLHFGYWKWPMNPLNRSNMLAEMVDQVVLALLPRPGSRFADLGCGYGTAARRTAELHGCAVTAITAVPQQASEGAAAAIACGMGHSVRMLCGDFRSTDLNSGSLDGVYAIESLDYGAGSDKADVLREAARIIKPGGRFAMAGGFLLKEPRGWRRRLVRITTEGWAIERLADRDAFVRAMKQAGFEVIEVRDISWRLAPSALHGLLLLLRLWVERRFSGDRTSPEERAHLHSCMAGIALGTQVDLFRYLIITARKAP